MEVHTDDSTPGTAELEASEFDVGPIHPSLQRRVGGELGDRCRFRILPHDSRPSGPFRADTRGWRASNTLWCNDSVQNRVPGVHLALM
jgi:hypothetical protein